MTEDQWLAMPILNIFVDFWKVILGTRVRPQVTLPIHEVTMECYKCRQMHVSHQSSFWHELVERAIFVCIIEELDTSSIGHMFHIPWSTCMLLGPAVCTYLVSILVNPGTGIIYLCYSRTLYLLVKRSEPHKYILIFKLLWYLSPKQQAVTWWFPENLDCDSKYGQMSSRA